MIMHRIPKNHSDAIISPNPPIIKANTIKPDIKAVIIIRSIAQI